jgi:hypothetical protein
MGDGQKNLLQTKKMLELIFAVNQPSNVEEQQPQLR